MTMKFANYAALSGATKQASNDIKEVRRSFSSQKPIANVEQPKRQVQTQVVSRTK